MFFELIRVALGNQERFSSIPSLEDWNKLFIEAQRQTLVGVAFEGVQKLPQEQWPPQPLLLQWIGLNQLIQQRNAILNGKCVELLSKLTLASLHPTILKGQAIANYYPPDLKYLRQAGDIDVYVNDGRDKAISFAKSIGQEFIEWDYKHLHLKIWDDTEVELHYHVEVSLNLWKNKKLQKWFSNQDAQIYGAQFEYNGFPITTPTVEFNVFYILLHLFRHFLYEGVGMRQIIDYYMVLRAVHDSRLMVQDYVNTVRGFGMEKFAKGLMWVMRESLGMPHEWMLWEPIEKEGRYILKQIMTGGNFGHHEKRIKHYSGKLGAVKAILSHNLHLLTHYPADVFWAPVWIVWHKLWKLTRA